MSNERWRSFLTPEQIGLITRVHVLGCGALGASSALALARMGFSRFGFYDNGRVEEVNIGAQPFSSSEIGLPKAQALLSRCARESPLVRFEDFWQGEERFVEPITEVFEDSYALDRDLSGHRPSYFGALMGEPKAVLLLGVDSMRLRRHILEGVQGRLLEMERESRPMTGLVIDQRMGLQEMWLQIMQSREDVALYLKGLHTDEETVNEPCTMRTIAYTPSIVAGWVGRIVAAFAREEPLPREIHSQIGSWNHWTVWPDGKVG